MTKNQYVYLLCDIPDDIFEEEANEEVFEEFETDEFTDEFFENREYLSTYCGYLTDAEYLHKYYGLTTIQ